MLPSQRNSEYEFEIQNEDIDEDDNDADASRIQPVNNSFLGKSAVSKRLMGNSWEKAESEGLHPRS